MKINTSILPLRILVILLLVSLSSCVIYSRSSDPTRIRSTNSAIVLTPEPQSGRNVSNVNGRIVVGTGMQVNDVETVNGRILIEDGAVARVVESVNGRIEIGGSSAQIAAVESVNGRITADNGGNITGTADSVNGRIHFSNVTVGKSIRTNNGDIRLYDVVVGENVETEHGDISLENSIIENDLIIREKRFSALSDLFNWNFGEQRVVVGPGSEIKGTLLAQEEITLYVHDTAIVNNIIGATPRSFSGSRP